MNDCRPKGQRCARRGGMWWKYFRAAQPLLNQFSSEMPSIRFVLRSPMKFFVLSVLSKKRFVLSRTEDRKNKSHQRVTPFFRAVLSVLTFFVQEWKSQTETLFVFCTAAYDGGPSAAVPSCPLFGEIIMSLNRTQAMAYLKRHQPQSRWIEQPLTPETASTAMRRAAAEGITADALTTQAAVFAVGLKGSTLPPHVMGTLLLRRTLGG